MAEECQIKLILPFNMFVIINVIPLKKLSIVIPNAEDSSKADMMMMATQHR